MHIPDREKSTMRHFTGTSGWPKIFTLALSCALILFSVLLFFIPDLLIFSIDGGTFALRPHAGPNGLETAPGALEPDHYAPIRLPNHSNDVTLELQRPLTEHRMRRQLQLDRERVADMRRLGVGVRFAPCD